MIEGTAFHVTGPKAVIGDRKWGNIWSEHTTGFNVVANAEIANKVRHSGTWVNYRLRVEGDHVTVAINNSEVLNTSIPDMPETGLSSVEGEAGIR